MKIFFECIDKNQDALTAAASPLSPERTCSWPCMQLMHGMEYSWSLAEDVYTFRFVRILEEAWTHDEAADAMACIEHALIAHASDPRRARVPFVEVLLSGCSRDIPETESESSARVASATASELEVSLRALEADAVSRTRAGDTTQAADTCARRGSCSSTSTSCGSIVDADLTEQLGMRERVDIVEATQARPRVLLMFFSRAAKHLLWIRFVDCHEFVELVSSAQFRQHICASHALRLADEWDAARTSTTPFALLVCPDGSHAQFVPASHVSTRAWLSASKSGDMPAEAVTSSTVVRTQMDDDWASQLVSVACTDESVVSTVAVVSFDQLATALRSVEEGNRLLPI